MPVFQIDITDGDGAEFRDEIEASTAQEARTAIENLGYTLRDIRIKYVRTLIAEVWYRIDRVLHPRKYDPATAYEYMLEKVRREHPELDE